MATLWGELGSKAWLGFGGGGFGVGGQGLAPSPPCGLPDVCKCDSITQYVAWASVLQYMLPYAFRRRLEMHGDFTGGSWQHGLAWLVYMWVCVYVCMQSCLGFTSIHVATCI